MLYELEEDTASIHQWEDWEPAHHSLHLEETVKARRKVPLASSNSQGQGTGRITGQVYGHGCSSGDSRAFMQQVLAGCLPRARGWGLSNERVCFVCSEELEQSRWV